MPLTASQIALLENSIHDYQFPKVYYNFLTDREVECVSMNSLELAIHSALVSKCTAEIKNGLSNILYWGYANSGYRDYRVRRFRASVTTVQLQHFGEVVSNGKIPQLLLLKSIRIPGFSAISFLSKVMMFLAPANHGVLDLQIAKLATESGQKALDRLTHYQTSIPATKSNQCLYHEWCGECLHFSDVYYHGKYRAVDIERGLFQLIRSGNLEKAKTIYRNC